VDKDNFRFTIFPIHSVTFAADRDYKYIICTDRETVSISAGHEIACTFMEPKVGRSLAMNRTNTFAINFL
jgi:hypothetical protein